MAPRVITDEHQARELGILLRALRSQARMTQEELADRSGLSIRTISDLERGRTTMPRRRSLAMLAEALQVRDGSLERFHETRQ
jgi:transcriptional regulator with XRE-family HTH domain